MRRRLNPGFSLTLKDGTITQDDSFVSDRSTGTIAGLHAISQEFDDLTLVYDGFDEPKLLVDYATRQRYIDAAHEGRLLSDEEANQSFEGLPFDVTSACSPSARVGEAVREGAESLPEACWLFPTTGPLADRTQVMTLVGTDPAASLDVCEHPEWFHLHGTPTCH